MRLLLSLILIAGTWLPVQAQITWARERVKHVKLTTRQDLAKPFYHSEYHWNVVKWPHLYYRYSKQWLSMENGVYQTNSQIDHVWATWSNAANYTITKDLRSFQRDNEPRVWVDLFGSIGVNITPPPADMGAESWITPTTATLITSDNSWWVTAAWYNTVDRELRFFWRTDTKTINGETLVFSHYRIPSNAVHYIVRPVIPEMREDYCLHPHIERPQGSGYLRHPQFVWGGWQDQWPWGGIPDGYLCRATATNDTIFVVIPTFEQIRYGWQGAVPPHMVRVAFEPAEVESLPTGGSVPPPPGGGEPGEVPEPSDVLDYKLVTFSGTPGRVYLAETSTNLVDWTPLLVAEEKTPGEYCVQDRRLTPPRTFYKINPID